MNPIAPLTVLVFGNVSNRLAIVKVRDDQTKFFGSLQQPIRLQDKSNCSSERDLNDCEICCKWGGD